MRAHLIGGGPGAMKAMRQHFREAIEGLPKNPLVAYVGVASGDNLGFLHRIITSFSGARVEQVKLARASDSVPEAVQLLADADAIFLSGGDVDLGMTTLRERNVLDPLRTIAANKRIIGLSAGSILAGRWWVRFPDDDDAKAERFECLGLVPLCFDAHSEDDDWAELRTLVRLSHPLDEDIIGYGLPAPGALVIESGATPHLVARGAATVRIGVRNGDVVTLPPLSPSSL